VTHPDWINPDVDLAEVNGQRLRGDGVRDRAPAPRRQPRRCDHAYKAEAISGDYDHLLQTSMAYAGMLTPQQ
jgi:hypothetical protein